MTRCSGCNRVALAVPDHGEETDNNSDEDVDIEGVDDQCELDGGVSKESKVIDNGEVNSSDQLVNNISYGEAEALTDEIEEETQVLGEVLRIKDVLVNYKDQSDSVLLESLRRLQLMSLTVDTLKATEIGKAVNSIRPRKHMSEEVRQLARTLVGCWKEMVDEWYNVTKALRVDEGTPDSVNPSIVDEEEGLPSPPLDVGAFFATQPTGIELAQFFDGMDDDGNPRTSGEVKKNREQTNKPGQDNHNILKRKQQTLNGADALVKDKGSPLIRQQEKVVKPSKPLNADFGPGRPKESPDQKANCQPKFQQKPDRSSDQRKPVTSQQDKFKCSDDVSVQMKLEATKRKLQERYQEAEDAKRQRTIQVMELQDLPKQGLVHKNQQRRPGIHNRRWAHGRR